MHDHAGEVPVGEADQQLSDVKGRRAHSPRSVQAVHQTIVRQVIHRQRGALPAARTSSSPSQKLGSAWHVLPSSLSGPHRLRPPALQRHKGCPEFRHTSREPEAASPPRIVINAIRGRLLPISPLFFSHHQWPLPPNAYRYTNPPLPPLFPPLAAIPLPSSPPYPSLTSSAGSAPPALVSHCPGAPLPMPRCRGAEPVASHGC